MITASLLDSLPPTSRLALAYAPRSVRPAWAALLALDARLAAVVRGAGTPIIGQIKLAWWREILSKSADQFPQGEPVLAALVAWQGQHGGLVALVDSYEILLGEPPLTAGQLAENADLRAAGFAALARLSEPGLAEPAWRQAARGWALADLALHLSNPVEVALVRQMIAESASSKAPLPRVFRPLVVLRGLAQRRAAQNQPGTSTSLSTLFTAMRLGMFGR